MCSGVASVISNVNYPQAYHLLLMLMEVGGLASWPLHVLWPVNVSKAMCAAITVLDRHGKIF